MSLMSFKIWYQYRNNDLKPLTLNCFTFCGLFGIFFFFKHIMHYHGKNSKCFFLILHFSVVNSILRKRICYLQRMATKFILFTFVLHFKTLWIIYFSIQIIIQCIFICWTLCQVLSIKQCISQPLSYEWLNTAYIKILLKCPNDICI